MYFGVKLKNFIFIQGKPKSESGFYDSDMLDLDPPKNGLDLQPWD